MLSGSAPTARTEGAADPFAPTLLGSYSGSEGSTRIAYINFTVTSPGEEVVYAWAIGGWVWPTLPPGLSVVQSFNSSGCCASAGIAMGVLGVGSYLTSIYDSHGATSAFSVAVYGISWGRSYSYTVSIAKELKTLSLPAGGVDYLGGLVTGGLSSVEDPSLTHVDVQSPANDGGETDLIGNQSDGSFSFKTGASQYGIAAVGIYPGYPVTFTESGLPAGARWYVNLSGEASLTSTTSSIAVNLTNGSYRYGIGTTNQSWAAPGGAFTVNGTGASESVTFRLVTYAVTFQAVFSPPDLPAITRGWMLAFNGSTKKYVVDLVATLVANGTYAYLLAGPSGYRISGIPPSGTITVHGAGATETFSFVKEKTYSWTFAEKGLPKGEAWCGSLGGWTICGTKSSEGYQNLTPGNYNYAVLSPLSGQTITVTVGKTVYAPTGELNLTGNTKATVTFVYLYAVAVTEAGVPIGMWWSVTVNGVTLGALSAGTVVPPATVENGTVVFYEPNGTYGYKVGTISGYASTGVPAKRVTVNGARASVSVTFAATGKKSLPAAELRGLSVGIVGLVGMAPVSVPSGLVGSVALGFAGAALVATRPARRPKK